MGVVSYISSISQSVSQQNAIDAQGQTIDRHEGEITENGQTASDALSTASEASGAIGAQANLIESIAGNGDDPLTDARELYGCYPLFRSRAAARGHRFLNGSSNGSVKIPVGGRTWDRPVGAAFFKGHHDSLKLKTDLTLAPSTIETALSEDPSSESDGYFQQPFDDMFTLDGVQTQVKKIHELIAIPEERLAVYEGSVDKGEFCDEGCLGYRVHLTKDAVYYSKYSHPTLRDEQYLTDVQEFKVADGKVFQHVDHLNILMGLTVAPNVANPTSGVSGSLSPLFMGAMNTLQDTDSTGRYLWEKVFSAGAGDGYDEFRSRLNHLSSDSVVESGAHTDESESWKRGIGYTDQKLVTFIFDDDNNEVQVLEQSNFSDGIFVPIRNLALTVTNGKFYTENAVTPTLTLYPGGIYVFNQSDSSNAGHVIKFSTTPDGTHGGGVEYQFPTGGVTYYGTPGVTSTVGTAAVAIPRTELVTPDTPMTLYYYCPNHPGMGGTINIVPAQFNPRIDSGTDGNRFENEELSPNVQAVIDTILSETPLKYEYEGDAGKYQVRLRTKYMPRNSKFGLKKVSRQTIAVAQNKTIAQIDADRLAYSRIMVNELKPVLRWRQMKAAAGYFSAYASLSTGDQQIYYTQKATDYENLANQMATHISIIYEGSVVPVLPTPIPWNAGDGGLLDIAVEDGKVLSGYHYFSPRTVTIADSATERTFVPTYELNFTTERLDTRTIQTRRNEMQILDGMWIFNRYVKFVYKLEAHETNPDALYIKHYRPVGDNVIPYDFENLRPSVGYVIGGTAWNEWFDNSANAENHIKNTLTYVGAHSNPAGLELTGLMEDMHVPDSQGKLLGTKFGKIVIDPVHLRAYMFDKTFTRKFTDAGWADAKPSYESFIPQAEAVVGVSNLPLGFDAPAFISYFESLGDDGLPRYQTEEVPFLYGYTLLAQGRDYFTWDSGSTPLTAATAEVVDKTSQLETTIADLLARIATLNTIVNGLQLADFIFLSTDPTANRDRKDTGGWTVPDDIHNFFVSQLTVPFALRPAASMGAAWAGLSQENGEYDGIVVLAYELGAYGFDDLFMVLSGTYHLNYTQLVGWLAATDAQNGSNVDGSVKTGQNLVDEALADKGWVGFFISNLGGMQDALWMRSTFDPTDWRETFRDKQLKTTGFLWPQFIEALNADGYNVTRTPADLKTYDAYNADGTSKVDFVEYADLIMDNIAFPYLKDTLTTVSNDSGDTITLNNAWGSWTRQTGFAAERNSVGILLMNKSKFEALPSTMQQSIRDTAASSLQNMVTTNAAIAAGITWSHSPTADGFPEGFKTYFDNVATSHLMEKTANNSLARSILESQMRYVAQHPN